jgi:hypothetical protein
MGIHHLVKNIVVGTMLALLSHISLADPLAQAAAITSLDHDTQALKKAVLDLNKELFLLEEELLYPANTQVAVFVSMDVGQYFALESVQVTMDGEHELVAIFTGKGPHGRDYKRGATLEFEKNIGSKYVELSISDRVEQLQPEFLVREWD